MENSKDRENTLMLMVIFTKANLKKIKNQELEYLNQKLVKFIKET